MKHFFLFYIVNIIIYIMSQNYTEILFVSPPYWEEFKKICNEFSIKDIPNDGNDGGTTFAFGIVFGFLFLYILFVMLFYTPRILYIIIHIIT